MTESRAQFATRLGVIATTVGSSVGLGNIWRFPYEAGTNGGGAFILCYLFFVFVIGIPVICAEFIMGRHNRSGILGCYRRSSAGRRWDLVGYAGVLAGIMILSFYSVIAGWTLEYLCKSIGGIFAFESDVDRHRAFSTFVSGWRPVMWVVVFLLINCMVVIRGVRKGVERISNILMPLLLLIIVIFCINSCFMPGAASGFSFLFYPDFSRLTPSVILSAMGQAFFSLSIGLGCMMTYASYFRDDTSLVKSAVTIGLLDTVVAILAGVMIFPAVFTFGVSPAEGPTLVFEVLPAIFSQMAGGSLWSPLFFFLLFLGALTSTISMSEIFIAFLCDEFGLNRRNAAVITTAIAIMLGSLCALSFGPLASVDLFDIFDFTTSNILLPAGGLIVCLFVGWKLDSAIVSRQIEGRRGVNPVVYSWLLFCLRYVAPVGIAIVFIAGLI
ncbi:MAG: sodium-dependent transporter [Muribaculaceae bacterium]|nr:sodium-dependent transporter [Muribaculaceae bacterium]